MSRRKKLRRAAFRDAVFSRDDHRCRVCGVSASVSHLDAHHITDRNAMPGGGYVPENGVALCPPCHERAEVWHASGHTRAVEGYEPDALYALIGSSLDVALEASRRALER